MSALDETWTALGVLKWALVIWLASPWGIWELRQWWRKRKEKNQ